MTSPSQSTFLKDLVMTSVSSERAHYDKLHSRGGVQHKQGGCLEDSLLSHQSVTDSEHPPFYVLTLWARTMVMLFFQSPFPSISKNVISQ